MSGTAESEFHNDTTSVAIDDFPSYKEKISKENIISVIK